MYYVSSKKSSLRGTLYGITDTLDDVEEFYDVKTLANMFYNKGLRIQGMIHTGSSFKFEIMTEDIIRLEELSRGSIFTLCLPKCKDMNVLYTGASDTGYTYFSSQDNKIHTITREFLLNNHNCIYVFDAYNSKALKEAYRKTFPNSHLSMFL